MAFTADRMSQHGPPDRCSNFRSGIESQKRNNEGSSKSPVKWSKLSVDNTNFTFIPIPHPEVTGKKVRVKFIVKELYK